MTQRFRSLDVFRGATVALMILVNNPGTWSALYPPLAHAPWHGCTPTDLVFPFFLFAVGNALAFVMPALLAGPAAAFWLKVAKRTLLIFAIGLFLNASPFFRWEDVRWLDSSGLTPELVQRSWDTLRVMGVLQRIALCFGAAAVIVWLCGRYTRYAIAGPLWATAVLLVGYAVACRVWGAAGDPYSLKGFFGTAVDVTLLGSAHLYKGEGIPFDPEGLASTVPAVAQVLLGWWVGQRVLAGRLDMDLVARLFLWATVVLLLAYVWQLDMPLNKKIWSPSYVLHTTGLAMMGLALMVYVLDIRPKPNASAVDTPLHATVHAGASFFEVFGKNPLFVFVLAGLVPRVLALLRWQTGVNAEGLPVWTSPLPWAYQTVFAPLGAVLTTDPRLGSFLYACANLSIYSLLARWLDQRRIYIRV
jgi:predicted acyltransferase